MEQPEVQRTRKAILEKDFVWIASEAFHRKLARKNQSQKAIGKIMWMVNLTAFRHSVGLTN